MKQLQSLGEQMENLSNDVGADRGGNTDPDKERRDATARFIESARWSSRPIYGAYQQFCNVRLPTVGLVVTGSPREKLNSACDELKSLGIETEKRRIEVELTDEPENAEHGGGALDTRSHRCI